MRIGTAITLVSVRSNDADAETSRSRLKQSRYLSWPARREVLAVLPIDSIEVDSSQLDLSSWLFSYLKPKE